MAKASYFKFDIELGLAKSNYKITPKDKSGRCLFWGASKNLGFPFNIYAMAKSSDFKFGTQLGFANYNRHKVTAWFLARRSLRNLAFPFNFLAMAEVAMGVPNELYYVENCKY